jgi:hypothetical protein
MSWSAQGGPDAGAPRGTQIKILTAHLFELLGLCLEQAEPLGEDAGAGP